MKGSQTWSKMSSHFVKIQLNLYNPNFKRITVFFDLNRVNEEDLQIKRVIQYISSFRCSNENLLAGQFL